MEEGDQSPIDGLSTQGKRPEKRPRGKIELKNVNFCYPTRPDVQVSERPLSLFVSLPLSLSLSLPLPSRSSMLSFIFLFFNP